MGYVIEPPCDGVDPLVEWVREELTEEQRRALLELMPDWLDGVMCRSFCDRLLAALGDQIDETNAASRDNE